MPCHVGVLQKRDMLAWLADVRPARVIDATHPYAVRATENIRACCGELGIPYERILRPPEEGAWRSEVQHAGIPASHIIAMQGPFSRALNAALYDQLGIRVMVTKDSGRAGGVEEKVIPALEREIHVILIDRPEEGRGCAENV